MGKMLPMLLFIISINLTLVVFLGMDPPGSSLWSLITNPQDWGNLSLIKVMFDAVTLSAVAGIVVGSFWTKSDFLIYATITSVFLSFGISIAELYNIINAWPELGDSASYIALIFIAPLMMTYLYVVLKFWRNAD